MKMHSERTARSSADELASERGDKGEFLAAEDALQLCWGKLQKSLDNLAVTGIHFLRKAKRLARGKWKLSFPLFFVS